MSAKFQATTHKARNAVLGVAMLAAILAGGCGSSAADAPADDAAGSNPYGGALEKARDVSTQANQRNRDIQDQMKQAEDSGD